MIDPSDTDPDYISPDDQERMLASLGHNQSPPVDEVIAEAASYAEASKPRTEKELYLDAARENAAHGCTRSRLEIAMAALESDQVYGQEARVLWGVLALMGKGTSIAVSPATVSRVCGYAEKTVKNILPRLEGMGFLVRTRMGFNGSGPAVAHLTLGPALRKSARKAMHDVFRSMGEPSNFVSTEHQQDGSNLTAPPTGPSEQKLRAPSAVDMERTVPNSEGPVHGALRSSETDLTAPPTGPSDFRAYIQNAPARAHLTQPMEVNTGRGDEEPGAVDGNCAAAAIGGGDAYGHSTKSLRSSPLRRALEPIGR